MIPNNNNNIKKIHYIYFEKPLRFVKKKKKKKKACKYNQSHTSWLVTIFFKITNNKNFKSKHIFACKKFYHDNSY